MTKKNPLTVISSHEEGAKTSQWDSRQATLERMWLLDEEQFNPERNCMEKERIQRICTLIDAIPKTKAIDLGCGFAHIVRHLIKEGIPTDALDACQKPLNKVIGVKTFLSCLPRTVLDDNSYDLVIATDVIAYLPKEQFRLFISELARIVTLDGSVVVSTPLDIASEDALFRFIALIETEFDIVETRASYHRLWIQFTSFLETPKRYSQAALDPEYKKQLLDQSSSFKNRWICWNTSFPLRIFWKMNTLLFNPLLRYVQGSRFLLFGMEKLSSFFWQEAAISHLVVVGKKRPLFNPLSSEQHEEKIRVKQRIWT